VHGYLTIETAVATAELTSSSSMVGEYRGLTGISEFTTLLIMVLVKSELHNCADMKIKEIGL